MKNFGRIMLGLLIIVLLFITVRACSVTSKIADPDNIITSYEEFESMYSTCNQVCDNIKMLKSADSKDMESGFSKSERILALQNKLNRWIREYNAKSRHISKSLWKSKNLPHQLSIDDFNCN